MDEQRRKESKSRAIKALIGCIIVVGVSYGTLSVLSNYFVELCTRLNATPTEVSLMFSVAMAFSSIAGFVASALIDKVPARILMFAGVVCYAALFVCLYFAQSIFVVYIGSAFYGCSLVLIGFTVAQTVITQWHLKGLGKKISSLSIAMSLTAMVLSPILALLLSNLGFETTILIHGGVLSLIALISVVALISNKPESYGLQPYGYEPASSQDEGAQAYVATGLTAKQAMGTYSFWAILIGVLLLMVFANGFTVLQSPIFQSCGFDLVEASGLISVFSGFSMLWVFIYGAITDKLGARKANIIFTVGTIVILIAFILIGGRIGGIFLAVTAGIGTTYSGVLASVTYSSLFGNRGIGTLISVSLAASGIGSMIAAPTASIINSITGSYAGYMAVSAVLLAVVLVLFATATSKGAVAKINQIAARNE